MLKTVVTLTFSCCIFTFLGCSTVAPPVPTIWQQLGIPQTINKIADATLNRKGLRPELERKPKLKRLVDPANLKPEAPEVLKVAGQIKQQEDLAPQKIKALKYLGKIGCGCYNKKNGDLVEKAILEALEDCTPSVRAAAVQAVATSAGSCCCTVDSCNGSPCCTDKIVKKLEEMAFKQDKNGCFSEPDANIRNQAANALAACPPKSQPETEIKETGYLSGASGIPYVPVDQNISYSRRNSVQPQGYNANTEQSRLIDCSVYDNHAESGTISVIFDKPYQIPTGSPVILTNGKGDIDCVVLQSQAGSVVLEATRPEQIAGFQRDQRLAIGVLSK